MSNQIALFDYAALPATDITEVRAAAERIRIRMKRTAEDIIEIGRDLLAVKARLPHGSFLPWIESEFGMAERTARNFMNVAGRFEGKTAIVADFSPTAHYLLASAPPEAVATIEARAQAGEHIDVASVKAELAPAAAHLTSIISVQIFSTSFLHQISLRTPTPTTYHLYNRWWWG